jgi:predicted DNA binding CopG/RHH family protein
MPKKPGPPLRQVNTRLFEEDVVYLEERAEREGTSYQLLIRALLHKAVQDLKRKRTVR